MQQDSVRDELIRSLFATYGQRLRCFVAGRTKDWSAAEDVVQEVMVRAWRHADTLDARGCLWAWLTTVTRNILIDQARTRKVKLWEACEEDEARYDSQVPDHADSLVDHVVLSELVDMLEPDLRAVVREVYFADRTTADGDEVPSQRGRCGTSALS
ncbi:sigma-70 family RNA polymerase sigma factor [Lentzea sp. NPDC059081]|uniref:sigma-70 family RNA polymerase sigma factor n=1 Tax=Lentzea sp. NPDC059081 TaxID=3346719 RepID=UPI00367AA72F